MNVKLMCKIYEEYTQINETSGFLNGHIIYNKAIYTRNTNGQ